MQGKEVGKDRNQGGSVTDRFIFVWGIRFLFDSQFRVGLFKVVIISKGNVAYNTKDVDNVGKSNLQIEGYTLEQVAYHCSLLCEGGYIHACDVKNKGNIVYLFYVERLTWEGHEFLDKIREDTVWKKTKETISEKGLPFIFDIVKSVSTEIISGMVKGFVGL